MLSYKLLALNADSLSMMGPLKPLWVIKIGPFSEYFLSLTLSWIWTSKVIPEQSLNELSAVEKEKRDGTGWNIECPRLFANRRPLEWPPVQIKIFLALKELSPLTNKLNHLLFFLFALHKN